MAVLLQVAAMAAMLRENRGSQIKKAGSLMTLPFSLSSEVWQILSGGKPCIPASFPAVIMGYRGKKLETGHVVFAA
jgi:hypothetical protein